MEKLVVDSQALRWLRDSILHLHADNLFAYFRDRGYAGRTQHCYIHAVAHFAHWLNLEKTDLANLNEQTVTRFLSVHLPHCDCPYPVLRSVHEIRAGLSHLLAALRAGGRIPPYQSIWSDQPPIRSDAGYAAKG